MKANKTFSCRDAGIDCDWQTSSESEEEIVKQAEEHGRKAHGMVNFDEAMKAKVRGAIREHKAA